MKKIVLVYFDAGGGHRAATMALRSVIEQQGRPWEVTALNLQEQLDPLDPFLKLTGIRLQDVYNRMLQRGWTLGSAQGLRALHALIRLFHGVMVRRLEAYWRESRPAIVVSLVPNFNRALWQSLRNAEPEVPYVTILTDFADYPPRFWMERQEQYFICGTERAVEQAREMGHAAGRVFRVSGMILNPSFYEPCELDRSAERKRLGLEPERATGLVMFGGAGSKAMLSIAERLERAELPVQLILICGRNEKLAERLRGQRFRMPVYVEGFTREVPRYMHISDFFIGKPGPGSLAEAVQKELPVIVERNAFTLPQERYNCDWILEKEVGLVLKSFRTIADAVRTLIEPATLERYRANTRRIRNRAVFEIPDVLADILARG